MQTLLEELQVELAKRGVDPLLDLLDSYNREKDAAKCYSTLAFLSCSASGGDTPLATEIAKVVEAFFLATSVHDDAVDRKDVLVEQSAQSTNGYLLLGDLFFARMGTLLATAATKMDHSAAEVSIRTFERYLFDVAQSQLEDAQLQGAIPSVDQSVKHMTLRGGTWGRICAEVPALAGGLSEQRARELGDAAEDLFVALTIRDDLRDLGDDLRNGVSTLAVATFFETVGEHASGIQRPLQDHQIDGFIELLHQEQIVDDVLDRARQYAGNAVTAISRFLEHENDMNWYLLSVIFRLVDRRFAEFTAADVRQNQLGIGFSELKHDELATIGL